MDEGLNSFVQSLAEDEWEEKYPSRYGDPRKITSYMKSSNQVPIMTNSESILQFGPNGYAKPAAALNILRETIVGREGFDFAFREYSQRWMFKRPYPADFFRSIEDASGVDLDWFWRAWFYSTDHVDIAITDVSHHQIDNGDPVANSKRKQQERDDQPVSVSDERNRKIPKRIERFPELKDFYNDFDDLAVSDAEKQKFGKYLKELDAEKRRLLGLKTHFYLVDLKNEGGIVMPVILKLTHEDDTTREVRLPAEVWVKNSQSTRRLILSQKPVKSFEVDPHWETADVARGNNYFPPQMTKSRFKLYKDGKSKNEMQKAADAVKAARAAAEKKKAAKKKKNTKEPAAKESK